MAKIFVSVFEKTAERAIERMAMIPSGFGIELRVDALGAPGTDLPLESLRAATSNELMYTRRARHKSERATVEEFFAAATAGFDVIDVEVAVEHDSVDLGWIPGISSFLGTSWGEKVLFSYHDWDGVPKYLEQIVEQLMPFEFKIAVTPKTLEENLRLLRILDEKRMRMTLFGMGEEGLYSRILAPFFGSELTFVAAEENTAAAPGQLTVAQAELIFADPAGLARPEAIFAVVGNPAAHSQSPMIHNPIFRARSARAAYSIIQTDDFVDVATRLLRGDALVPQGLSITAPFKEEAFHFAVQHAERITPYARRAQAVNTLVRMADGSLEADNSDVSGFVALIAAQAARPATALVLGSGGTARAALVALEQLGIRSLMLNRTTGKGKKLADEFGASFRPLSELGAQHADLIIDTLPAAAAVDLPPSLTERSIVITADYSVPRTLRAATHLDGLALLEAQATKQSELFLRSMTSGLEQTRLGRKRLR